jgi:pimeloyl-ACP methyl ester carboxylesterase
MKPYFVGARWRGLWQGVMTAAMLCTAPGAGAADQPPVPVLEWTDCRISLFDPPVDCAFASVPLDYAYPHGATTEVLLARYRTPDQANKRGTVFVAPGGPGLSGAAYVRRGFGAELSALLKDGFDVVGFDPRGVRNAYIINVRPRAAFLCGDNGEPLGYEAIVAWGGSPLRREQERPYYDNARALAQKCLGQGRNQPIASHMSTADVARDLDLLRQAVGDEQLTYLGLSYGTYLGMTYANLFPNKVRALALDGVIDPRLWSAGWQIIADRVAPLAVWKEFLRLCDEARERCPFWREGGSQARYDKLREKLRGRSIDFAGATITADTLTYIAYGVSRGERLPAGWAETATYLYLIDGVADGQALRADEARALGEKLGRGFGQGWSRGLFPDADSVDAFLGNVCSDIEFPRFFEAYSAIGAYVGRRSFIAPLSWWPNAACAAWPVAKDRYTGPWTARTSKPVLLVGNYFDGVTSYESAVNTSRLLKGSRLLSYAGLGHTAFANSDCAKRFIAAYLYDGTLPPEGTVCPAKSNPFILPVQEPPTGAADAKP